MCSLENFWKNNEGNDWFRRNKLHLEGFTLVDKEIIENIKKYNMNKTKILEIGCCEGSRLNHLSKHFMESKLYGLDVSQLAVQEGQKKYPNINFLKPNGIEELQKLESEYFDIIIFGHSFMVFDICNYQRIIYESCRILKSKGHIIISDWYSKTGKTNITWKHNPSYHCNKFDYSKFFTVFPNYILINRTFLNHESNVDKNKDYEFDNIDNVLTIDIIRKFNNADINNNN